MTLEDWLAAKSAGPLSSEIFALTDRKIHLLTAAFLRRVWDDLPSEHTRTAVEATEALADGRITAKELARLRSTDLLESCEGLWLAFYSAGHEQQLIGEGCLDCSYCDQMADEYVCRATREGKPFDAILATVEAPALMAIRAALHARETVVWKALPGERDAAEADEARVQFALFREIGGDGSRPDARWPRWRTLDVRALARGIHRDGAFDRLPILADALQDAGCDDEDVLQHCRRLGGHVRGCWVVDLAMGFD